MAMFVAVTGEFATDDHRQAAQDLLAQYGFQRVLKDVWESAAVTESALGRLKRDLDRLTDSYDSLRFYQYPVGDTLAITVLKEKRWRRLVVTR
jgi:CRISPR-associated protein Cas2